MKTSQAKRKALCSNCADRDSIRQFKSDGKSTQKFVGIGCPALCREFLFDIPIHVIASCLSVFPNA